MKTTTLQARNVPIGLKNKIQKYCKKNRMEYRDFLEDAYQKLSTSNTTSNTI